MHSKIMCDERSFLPPDSPREEIILNPNKGMVVADCVAPGQNRPIPYFLTIAQLPSPIGRKASAAGIVATSL